MNYREAFTNTDYIVNIDNKEVIINIDKLHPQIDEIIKPFKTWAFITAHNPLPQILSNPENLLRNNRLKEDVEKLGNKIFNGYGLAKDKSWREDSFMIIGIDKEDAKKLGAKFGQLAIVTGCANEKALLIILK